MNNEIKVCPKCHYKTSMFYCPKCGEIIKYPSFVGDNNARKETLQLFVKNVVSIAKQQEIDIISKIDNSSLKNAIYRMYYEHIAYLQKLCSNKTTQSYFVNNGCNLFNQMNSFAEKCESGDCHIAVVGTVKAGKSMFINALIGQEIASSYPTPETASVTKFRKSEKGNYVKVSFYSTKEWNILWDSVTTSFADSISKDENEDFKSLYKILNAESIRDKHLNRTDEIFYTKTIGELKIIVDKYTSARYPEHFFAKEVEIGLSDFFAPSNVVIVDTPGLDDPVPYRTDITRKYLHKANVILLCLRSNRPEISATELKQLTYIFAELRYCKERIITIGTQIDEQRDMLGYWERYTLPEYLKYLSRSSLYGSKDMAVKQIFPATAYYYMLFKKFLDNPHLLNEKSDEAKQLRDKLSEVVRRYYYIPELNDLIEELGTEEALKIYKSPKQVFDEHHNDLLEMTQIPTLRKMMIDGPIKNSNDIILNDIKLLYANLCAEISNAAKDISSHKLETIKVAESKNIKEKIVKIEQQIKQAKELHDKQVKQLNNILSTLENKSKDYLNKIKS